MSRSLSLCKDKFQLVTAILLIKQGVRKMTKRIGMNDWVFGKYNKWEYIGFVLTRDKSQVRVQMTQMYNTEVRKKEDMKLMKNTTITAQISNVSPLDEFHIDDIMELIDMALDNKSKRDFNRLTNYLEEVKSNKDKPSKKLWKVKRDVR